MGQAEDASSIWKGLHQYHVIKPQMSLSRPPSIFRFLEEYIFSLLFIYLF